MKSTSVAIVILLQLAVVGCCRPPTPPDAIIGMWECTNFKTVSHVADFKQCFGRFNTNGVCTSWLINDEGGRVEQPTFNYHFDGQTMWDDENTNTAWRISIHGDRMTMTTIRDPNPDNVGCTLKHRRVKE